jgi:hypothetical protein
MKIYKDSDEDYIFSNPDIGWVDGRDGELHSTDLTTLLDQPVDDMLKILAILLKYKDNPTGLLHYCQEHEGEDI